MVGYRKEAISHQQRSCGALRLRINIGRSYAFLRRGDEIRTRVVASKRKLHVADRERSRRLEELRDTQAATEPGPRHLSPLPTH